MLTVNETILATTDGTTSPSSTPFWLKYVYGYDIQAVFTGTLAGTAKLQGSDDLGTNNELNPAQGLGIVNWTDVKDSSQAVTAAGTINWNVTGAFYRWVRFVYTNSSGTGNVTVVVNSKGA